LARWRVVDGGFVEGAVMSPVGPFGHTVPVLFAGAAAAPLAERPRPFGMQIEVVGRVLAHGARRAEEMRCAAETVRAIGLKPVMCEAIAARQQWVADLGLDPASASNPHTGSMVDALIDSGRLGFFG
jgi:hypothetical protein